MNLLKHTPDRDLMLANVEALATDETQGTYEDYYNLGHYVVTRDGEGGVEMTPEQWLQFSGNITSDVVLVTYYNDCKWHRRRTCHENLRTMPPVVIYQRP